VFSDPGESVMVKFTGPPTAQRSHNTSYGGSHQAATSHELALNPRHQAHVLRLLNADGLLVSLAAHRRPLDGSRRPAWALSRPGRPLLYRFYIMRRSGSPGEVRAGLGPHPTVAPRPGEARRSAISLSTGAEKRTPPIVSGLALTSRSIR